ncbi:LytR C-terminal domain-containing protein [Luteipulveratus flavus]|uniref:LytR C-terminal domain-containing protein n=1 Tax=Luteipulveratus flavus TaxID=3031728 RepID=A0ABT6CD37_9MICO|nr:LytR C-terminal domain-containing protein [Luteipulveratus sp. YIM 133296]MDF8266312.1 LytR C-terminal domain-containing protein [Luteipulveratus sp. YIM 133296]
MSQPAPHHRRPYETGLARARRRRHRRAVAVISLVGILVVATFVYSVLYVQNKLPGQQAATPTCTVTATPTVDPQSAFRLNIYNAGGQQGRANDVALAMKSRGFDVGVVGNDPYKKRIAGVGEIRFGASGEGAASQYIHTLAPGAQLVQDGRTDTSVDVVVGSAFPSIPTAPPKPAPTTAAC